MTKFQIRFFFFFLLFAGANQPAVVVVVSIIRVCLLQLDSGVVVIVRPGGESITALTVSPNIQSYTHIHKQWLRGVHPRHTSVPVPSNSLFTSHSDNDTDSKCCDGKRRTTA